MSKGHTQGRSQAVERVYPVLRHLVRTHNQLQIGKVNLYRESPARDADVATRVTIAWDDDTSTWPLAPRSGAAVPTQSRWSVLWVGGTCTPLSIVSSRSGAQRTPPRRRGDGDGDPSPSAPCHRRHLPWHMGCIESTVRARGSLRDEFYTITGYTRSLGHLSRPKRPCVYFFEIAKF